MTINFPTSLINEGILIESQSPDQKPLLCEYFVQVGAYGNKKYALEAENMLKSEIQNISIKTKISFCSFVAVTSSIFS